MIKKAFLGLVVLSATLLSGAEAAEKTPPNFIIFYIDDLSWAQTSVRMMDSEPESVSDFYHTPGVERLAERGMRFSNGYCPTPTCTGSRISIQFGKTSARMQYRFVHDVLSKKQRPDGYTNEVSIAGVLKASGKKYITAHFGKGIGVEQLRDVGYDVTDEFETSAPNGNLHGDKVDSPDIRAGMALLIAALCAEGQSTIRNIWQIDRGYGRIENKLRQLGARIKRVSA